MAIRESPDPPRGLNIFLAAYVVLVAALLLVFVVGLTMFTLVLKRAPIGDNQDDYDVLENGVIVGRIFTVPTGPQGRPWMWASGHNGSSPFFIVLVGNRADG